TDCFLTFGIEKPTLPHLNSLNTLHTRAQKYPTTASAIASAFVGVQSINAGGTETKNIQNSLSAKNQPR
ncbi:MAG: hypothetical protein MR542_00735, partial [Bacteroidales bacterium]|nr:hypothetical protein [Bacteroidales bacterium]